MASSDYIRFVTGVHFAKAELRAFNSMTFFLDPNWDGSKNSAFTFPFAFFGVKTMHEVMESEVSSKQMLFYNSSSSTSKDTTTGSLLNVVADNIINKPKQYKLEVIIPYDNLSLLLGNSHYADLTNVEGVVNKLTENVAGGKIGAVTRTLTSYINLAVPYMTVIKTLLKSVLTANINSSDLTSMVTNVMSTPDFNKNSLEAMWNNRSIIKMKLWNSWKPKYVAITNMDITKEGTAEGVYEATINVQEVPIMTFLSNRGTPAVAYKSVAQGAVEALNSWLDKKMKKEESK